MVIYAMQDVCFAKNVPSWPTIPDTASDLYKQRAARVIADVLYSALYCRILPCLEQAG